MSDTVFKLPHTPSALYYAGKGVLERLRAAGHRAFMVGGCVRDMVLGIPPKEYDITTSATPDEITSLFPRTVPIGASFGVVLVLHEDFQFEVATFRTDVSYSDGRHPDSVVYSKDEREDVKRRDFTINAMLYDPETEEVIDYTGGMRDIERRLLRTIGRPEDRLSEDKLRMLRAVRFSARLGYGIERGARGVIELFAPQITQVSRERIRDEIIKMFTQENPGEGLKLLHETGLLEHVLPDVAKMDGVQQPPEFHPEGDVLTHTRLVLDKLYEYVLEKSGLPPSLELAIGALLHDVGKPPTFSVSDRIRFNAHDSVGAEMAVRICRELRFSKKQTERIRDLVRHHLKFKDVLNMRRSTLKRFLAMPYFEDHLALHFADCMASHRNLTAYDYVSAQLEELDEQEIRPEPLLTGRDLIEMGYEPGPVFSEILHHIEEAQLQGEVAEKEAAKSIVRETFPLTT